MENDVDVKRNKGAGTVDKNGVTAGEEEPGQCANTGAKEADRDGDTEKRQGSFPKTKDFLKSMSSC